VDHKHDHKYFIPGTVAPISRKVKKAWGQK